MMKKLLLLLVFSVVAFAVWAQSTHTIDFEPAGVGADWEWTVAENADNPPLEFVSNPSVSGINTSATTAKFIARLSGNPWALCFTSDDGEFTFDASNKIVKVMVYKPVISDFGFKVEGTSGSKEIIVANTVINQWEELTFDFSEVIGNTYSLLVLIPDFDFGPRTQENICYFDNIQVPDGAIVIDPAPTTQPMPQPSADPEDVTSVYSDVYTGVGATWHPGWGQTTLYSEEIIAGTLPEDHIAKLKAFGYEGITFPSTNVESMEYVHFDVWSYDETSIKFFLLAGGQEPMISRDLATEQWNSFNVPLSEFAADDLTDISGIKLESGTWTWPNGTTLIYVDNIYFWKEPSAPGSDATLSDLQVDGTTIAGFSPTVLTYSMELPNGTTEVPTVTATTNDPLASRVINPATSLPGTTDVVVTSANGNNTKTYSIEFTLSGTTPTSDYCETEVWHFMDPGLTVSAIYLTITNLDESSMFIEIESVDADPVDLLLVLGGSGAAISEPNTSVPGKISRTLTWAGTPPTNVDLTILWSKESELGNWMLGQDPITVPFEASCSGGSNSLTFNPQDGATDVEVSINPTITFSPDVEMADGTEITNADIAELVSFKETNASGADVTFVGTINAEKTVITINPDTDLVGGQVYYFALDDEVIRYVDVEGDLIPGQNITFTTVAGVKPYLALDVQDNFEDDGWGTIDEWFFQDPDMVPLTVVTDPVNPANNVADYNRSGGFEYTNAQFVLDHRMDLSQRNTFEIKVYFPSSNDYSGALAQTAAIKLQNSLLGGNAWTTQTEVKLDVTQLDQWVTLTFNFSTAAANEDYDQVVVQLGGEGHNDPGQFYFDDIELLPAATGLSADFVASPLSGFAPLNVQFTDLSTGDPTSWQWDFDNDGVIDSNVQNPSYTYDEPGLYSVFLKIGKVFNSDEITKVNYVQVNEIVTPPYIYTDFDENVNATFEGWPNIVETVPNPDPSGINTSANVGQWARSTEPYANVYTIVDSTINFGEGSIFTLQVYAPLACEVLFKLENTSTGESTQRFASVSALNEWQILGFDFTGEQSDLYDNIIIFFDFENDVDNIFYFDDIRGPEPNGEPLYKPLLALDVQDNFEDDGYATIQQWYFQDPDLIPLNIVEDPANSANHVAEYNRSGTFEWTNAQFILDHRMDLSERNQFEMKVYFPSSNNYFGGLPSTAAVKLQNSLLEELAYTTQTEIIFNVADFDQWLTLEFDFSAIADSVNYDQVVVQLGGEEHLVDGLFYFDDFVLTGGGSNGTLTFNPPDGATGVDVTTSPALTFSVPVAMADGSEIGNENIADLVSFKETDASGTDVQFVGTINAEKTVITIDPVADLENGQIYFLALNNEVIRYMEADLIPGQSITFTTVTGVKPYLALDVQDNFEDDGWGTIDEWFFQDPDMLALPIVEDLVNPGNHVADYMRSGNFEWTNAQFILEHRMDLTERNVFEIKVYFPSSNDYAGALTPTVAIKLQNSLLGGNAWETQKEILQTIAEFDQWVTLSFDFSEVAGRDDFDQVVVQFGGEGHFVPGQFYFDDIRLLGVPMPYIQTVALSEGWSGISGFVIPSNSNIEDLFEPIISDVEMIVGETGFYYPSQGTNTLGNWDSQTGYMIKMHNANQLTIEGTELASRSHTAPQGWSVLPVLSGCEVSVEDVFGSLSEVVSIKDIAEVEVYWPEKEVYKLTTLQPGTAYMIYTNAEVSFMFPECTGDYSLVWSDEFDGTEINMDNWTFETGATGWGNNELQNYTDGENAEVVDGKLIITARLVDENMLPGSYTSSRVITMGKQEFQYGRMEISARLPSGTGIWPAIWMMGSNFESVGWPACGEMDIMEYVGWEPNTVHSYVHTTSGSGGAGSGSSISLPTCEEEFHKYGLTWTSDELIFYVDTPDNVVHTYAPEIKTDDNWPFNQPAFFLLNVAVGGTWGGAQGIDNSIFPQSMEVDYVRVYQKAN